MAILNNILTVNWDVSPRIITVASGTTEITIQDLLDTCRTIEVSVPAMDEDHLIDAAGKEFLGGITYVGLTATLNNAVLAFEALPGPDWTLCSIIGGNLVAIDVDGVSIDPRTPTSYITVDRTSSASATLQEQESLQYSSFQNAVWVDTESDDSGTVYPAGTREHPVNNLTSAVVIANERGFSVLQIVRSMVIDSGSDLSGFTLQGQSHVSTYINILPTANCSNLIVRDCNVSGTLDGGTEINECVVGDIVYFNGHIHNSGLVGTLHLAGDTDAAFTDCRTIDITSSPTIDIGGTGNDLCLSMPNYSGELTLANIDQGADVNIAIGLDSGQVVLDSTISGGAIIVSGVGMVIDNSSGTATVNTDGLMSKDTISRAVWDEDVGDHLIEGSTGQSVGIAQFAGEVWISTTGVSGTTFPAGTQSAPVNNIADANIIAAANGIDILHIREDFTFGADVFIADYSIHGDGLQSSTFTFTTGCIVANCQFLGASVTGDIIGATGFEDCLIEDLISTNPQVSTNIVNVRNCLLRGTTILPSTFEGSLQVIDCWGLPTSSGTPPTLDMDGGAFDVQFRNYSGYIIIDDCTSDVDIRIMLNSGGVTLTPSITAGNFIFTGVGTLEDNSTSVTSIHTDALINKVIISTSVWDEPVGSHLIEDTMGHQMHDQSFDGHVMINTASGTSGTTYPTGTHGNPVDNLPDALLIAAENSFSRIMIMGSLTIDGEDITGYTFEAARSLGNSITITSMVNTGHCYFENLTVAGALSGGTRFTTSVLGALTGYDGGAKNCLITDDITITGAGANYFTDCDTYVVSDTYKEISLGSNLLNIIKCRGSFGINDYTGSAVIAIDLVAGQCRIADTCVSGTIVTSGLTQLTDNSGPGCYVIDASLTQTGVADAVWNDDITDNTVSGTAGEALNDTVNNARLIPAVL